ncbi:MAG: signal transduction histidine kinase [Rickettsiales bacterium]|jgi:signal transduction histidine kinase
MTQQNYNDKTSEVQNLKSLAGSIAHEVRNPLSAIKGCCEIVRSNLDEAIEYLDLISLSSSRGLMIAEMILSNIREQEIDKSQFTNLSMSNIINSALKEYAFESTKEKDLVNINLENDFSFRGEETLMIFVLFNLLKNSLYYKAKIDIWLEKDGLTENGVNYNLLHFKDYG